jgi:catechol 2,3-dioxygenase-like lactoylglutathione lyase family enzyme
MRMDHVSVVVEDLESATAFFAALGMELEGATDVEGPAVDALNGLAEVRAEIAMMRTPDGHGRLELTTFLSPALARSDPPGAPPNTLGLRSVMFEVEDLDDALGRLEPHGAELIGEVVQYQDSYRLCYLRGPAGIIVALAQPLG